MDLRERRLTADIRHLADTLKDMSEEFLIIQDFIKHEFGAQLTAYLKTRKASLLANSSKLPLLSCNLKGRGRGVASGGIAISKAKAISNLRKRKVGKNTLGNGIKRSRSQPGDGTTVYNAMSDDEVNSCVHSPIDCDTGEDVSNYLEQNLNILNDAIDQEELTCNQDDEGECMDLKYPIDEQQPESSSSSAAVAIKVEVCDNEENAVDETSALPFDFDPSDYLIVSEGDESIGNVSAKIKRVILTLRQKIEIIDAVTSKQKTPKDIQREYGIAKSTVTKIVQQETAYRHACSVNPANRKKIRGSSWPDLEKELGVWLNEMWMQNIHVTRTMIKEKAKSISNDQTFTASDGWLTRFKERSGLTFKFKTPSPTKEPDPVMMY